MNTKLHPFNAQLHESAQERAEAAARMKRAGMTWAQVGEALGGVSRQRAQQIASRAAKPKSRKAP